MQESLSVVVSVILGIEDEGAKGRTARQLTPNLATARPALAGTNLQFEIDKSAQVSNLSLCKWGGWMLCTCASSVLKTESYCKVWKFDMMHNYY